ncbi:MAG TPA: penicillin-binding transpeptidase domain-containing protein [Candidatus Paceibacterota bacterium]|nr:penicillin-binding transpeptidase domain-containing protein [Candidatus Paceibacterota bacterium]
MKRWQRPVYEIDPEEIFLDSSNLPAHDASQFEGRLGPPVSGRALFGVGIVFLIVVMGFASRAYMLEVAKGSSYASISRNNTLDRSLIFATRGIIYDRTGRELAWNIPQPAAVAAAASSTSPDAHMSTSTQAKAPASPASFYALRQYINEPGFALLLGFVRYPQADASGEWWQSAYTGIDGIELEYNDLLSGENGATLTETDAHGKVQETNIIAPSIDGQNITLSIDADVQTHLFDALVAHAQAQGFRAGAGVVMDVRSGQVLALTSFPEYDEQGFTDGKASAIRAATNDPLTPMLDRAVSGLYAPGSIMKTIFAAAALNENLISPDKEIDSVGKLSIPNPYDPSNPTIFHDWAVHGWIDMRTAIAVSSDEYFYTIGGGYGDQPGLGISKLDEYATRFGIGTTTGIDLRGEKAGVIPSPAWKAIAFPNDPTWRLGDTYHSAIGQYGFLITPIQAVRYAAAIANGGKLYVPHLLASSTPSFISVDIPDADLEVVREGMRLAVTSNRKDATVSALNIPGIDIAAKTGTAQIGAHNQYVNSWSIGFWPANDPKYAYAVVLEQGPSTETAGVAPGMTPFFQWLVANHPEYVN